MTSFLPHCWKSGFTAHKREITYYPFLHFTGDSKGVPSMETSKGFPPFTGDSKGIPSFYWVHQRNSLILLVTAKEFPPFTGDSKGIHSFYWVHQRNSLILLETSKEFWRHQKNSLKLLETSNGIPFYCWRNQMGPFFY